MRKKLLSLLTVLCLVLGMLPATALAAEYADLAKELGYSEEEVAMYIDEDTELSEDVEGLIIVVAPVKVTVKGAKLATGLVVVPDAEGATVTLGENADVNAVIVMAKAEVTVEETAVAASVTVTAPEASVTVAGTVETVTLAEEAENAVVTVAETAKVETVEVAAPAAAVEVVGEVKTVAVQETAAAATVTVAETATVSALEVAAPDVKADVAGTVESVTVAETATGAELAVAETATVTEVTDATGELTVSGDGADKVTVNDTTASEEEEEDEEDEENINIDVPFVPPVVETKKVKICWANQGVGDQSQELSGNHSLNGVTMNETNKTTTVDAVVQEDGSARGDVKLNAGALQSHDANGVEGTSGYLIGFGVELPEKEGGYPSVNNTLPEGDENSPYRYYIIEKTPEADWRVQKANYRTQEEVNTFFNTLYFNIDTTWDETLPAAEDAVTQDVHKEYIVVVTEGSTDHNTTDITTAETEGAHTEDIEGTDKDLTLAEGEDIVYVFDVTIDATLVKPDNEEP